MAGVTCLGLGNIGQGIVKALRKAGIEVTGTDLELGKGRSCPDLCLAWLYGLFYSNYLVIYLYATYI